MSTVLLTHRSVRPHPDPVSGHAVTRHQFSQLFPTRSLVPPRHRLTLDVWQGSQVGRSHPWPAVKPPSRARHVARNCCRVHGCLLYYSCRMQAPAGVSSGEDDFQENEIHGSGGIKIQHARTHGISHRILCSCNHATHPQRVSPRGRHDCQRVCYTSEFWHINSYDR